MRVVRHIADVAGTLDRPVLTLGNFDGVHVGHQEILDRVVREARVRGAPAMVITFFPHPAAVLSPDKAPPPIASIRDRLERLAERGVDVTVLRRFTPAFARTEAEDFVSETLVGALRVSKIVIGHSVSFGRGRRGNAELLQAEGRRHGFEVETVGPVRVDDIVVSSTEIRRRIAAADLEVAARLLGRAYGIEGRVVSGARRGKGLGFPTANVRPRTPFLAPDGVYAVRVELRGEECTGIANIGRNPTFGPGQPRGVEAHLFEFDGDLYGERITVRLVERIRSEMRFPSPRALVEQIRRDVERAHEILARR